jgi:hypothetical protein
MKRTLQKLPVAKASRYQPAAAKLRNRLFDLKKFLQLAKLTNIKVQYGPLIAEA